jgi:hypothetical protein
VISKTNPKSRLDRCKGIVSDSLGGGASSKIGVTVPPSPTATKTAGSRDLGSAQASGRT